MNVLFQWCLHVQISYHYIIKLNELVEYMKNVEVSAVIDLAIVILALSYVPSVFVYTDMKSWFPLCFIALQYDRNQEYSTIFFSVPPLFNYTDNKESESVE